MASVNPLSRELVFKIVYYGPGLGGKTTTLEHLHATAKPEHRGKLVSLATPVDRTLYFDFLPIRIPSVRGMNVRLQLFTVPGQVYFNATRKLVLTGADGVVFVSDSQAVRADANMESLANLRENLLEQGRELSQMPLIFQHNKRDLEGVLPLEDLDMMLNHFGAASVPSSATTGAGVYESLQRISERVMKSFESKMPELAGSAGGVDFSVIEGGLAHALREVSESAPPPPPLATTYADFGVPAEPTSWPSMPPNAMIDEPSIEVASDEELGRGDSRAPNSTELESANSFVVGPLDEAEGTSLGAGISFVELWSAAEEDSVRDVEAAIASHRYADAVELCELLVSRVFASTAGLLGTSDAPRDASVVSILLGLDGRRYLGFRALVREARNGALISARAALTAYAFAIDVRIARSSLGPP